MNYSFFVILGSGRLAIQCGKYLKENYSIPAVVYDVNPEPSASLKNNCQKTGLDYRFEPKQQLFASLSEIEAQTLIISAYIPYIIPANILDKPNISAINFHPSLLPVHPGRNSEAWAIYEMDEYAGITWHIITEKVDKGEIIAQQKLKLDDRITSMKLLALQYEAAFKSFKGFIDSFLNGSCTTAPQSRDDTAVFHYLKDRPNGGRLDLNWPADKISAFLRAYDYGFYDVIGKPHLIYEGTTYQWKGYKITSCELSERTVTVQQGDMLIREGTTEIRLTHMSPVP